jgi:hypothetical protein
MRAPLAAALALVAAACGVPDHGPTMEPGNDCMDCHGSVATSFTAAGTVYSEHGDRADAGVANVQVHLVGSDGREVVAQTNSAGNFYTKERIAFPAQVRIEKDGRQQVMELPAQEGRCNRCHTLPPRDGAEGRMALVHTEHEHEASAAAPAPQAR